MADRLQTRFEHRNLGDMGYMGDRLETMGTEYREHLRGRGLSDWLRVLAVEMIRRADRIDGRPALFDPDEAPQEDALVRQIRQAPTRVHLERIRYAYRNRWNAHHDALYRTQLAEINRKWD